MILFLSSASMIWIIGEYSHRIDNADELLESFLLSIKDENYYVQCQLLTAIVKLFLHKPVSTSQALVARVLQLITQVIDRCRYI
jgi:vesicle coat complex subunit